ncbi:MAG: peptide chain release factor 3 [Oligoflexia bacterium]|nr:peptide chain release factor 3 [Oligoflexia bacterium]
MLVDIAREAGRRRTFGIISHPDAGKTTITEKLLLYSGAIHLAGSVKGRKVGRLAVSDWMKMEQERGISITSSVLQFQYQGAALNLLDTPGHADFSEDTYRTLAAVDSAVMLMDHTKGVESRTRKLFEVCRMRSLPVVTFMNKLDRPGLEPMDLIDEVSRTLNLAVCPLNWPIGMGRDFKGVVEPATGLVHLYEEKARHGVALLKTRTMSLDEARETLGDRTVDTVSEEIELLAGAGDPWDVDAYLQGDLSPVFWGSAMTNFGVEPLLQFLASHAAVPARRTARQGDDGELTISVRPQDPAFTGFIFKIQANMNPRHRDRVAFMRVVSGRFDRGMDVIVGRTGGTLRLRKPHTFMADERSIVDEAWPGDIVGLYDPGNLRIGDTLSVGRRLHFDGIPRFAPEFYCRVVLRDPLRRKKLDTGLTQLAHEGVIQLFYRPETGHQDPWLGAVGQLQFEVLRARLEDEYGVKATLEPLRYRHARWIGGAAEGLAWLQGRRDYSLVEDRNGQPVVLTETPWMMQYAAENAPGIELFDVEPL